MVFGGGAILIRNLENSKLEVRESLKHRPFTPTNLLKDLTYKIRDPES